jgi:acyl-CoA reductase-like NAD-dependent aldehyde dehydrogenase
LPRGPVKNALIAAYVTPTIVEVAPESRLWHEVIFSPVLACTHSTLDQAVALANGSIHGLTASVWSDSLSRRTGSQAGCAQGPSQ